jgi:hypothetical protein
VIDLGIPFPDQTAALLLVTVLISGLHFWVAGRLPPRPAMA